MSGWHIRPRATRRGFWTTTPEGRTMHISGSGSMSDTEVELIGRVMDLAVKQMEWGQGPTLAQCYMPEVCNPTKECQYGCGYPEIGGLRATTDHRSDPPIDP